LIATPPKQVDRIVIEKSQRTLTLMSGSDAVKAYKAALGGSCAYTPYSIRCIDERG
jgi:hypothetical protein